jgi:hypothetical protein
MVPLLSHQPFPPPDLFELRGPWVRIFGMPEINPVASQHAPTFSRSSFPYVTSCNARYRNERKAFRREAAQEATILKSISR